MDFDADLIKCHGKHGFSDRATAARVLKQRTKKHNVKGFHAGSALVVYKCEFCSAWHLCGDNSAKRKKKHLASVKSRKRPSFNQ